MTARLNLHHVGTVFVAPLRDRRYVRRECSHNHTCRTFLRFSTRHTYFGQKFFSDHLSDKYELGS